MRTQRVTKSKKRANTTCPVTGRKVLPRRPTISDLQDEARTSVGFIYERKYSLGNPTLPVAGTSQEADSSDC